MPESAIIIEPRATNTGQNMQYARTALAEAGVTVDSALLICKPYMERRAYATARKLWPEIQALCASAPLSFDDYLASIGDHKLVIDMLAGDLQRIIEYPALGFAITQHVPHNVETAYKRLVAAGFDSRLLQN